MPHTKDGIVINVGDTFNVPVKVCSVQTGNEYCNVTVETVEPMFPSNNLTTITLNTKQLVSNKLKGFGIPDIEAYAKKAIHLLQTAGEPALAVLEAGFKIYSAFTNRDLSGILQAFQEAQGNIQKVIDAIQGEFGQ